MKLFRYAFVACVVFGLSGCGGGDSGKTGGEGNASKIVGTWEDAKERTTVEFTSGGSIIVQENQRKEVGTYQVNGDKIKMTLGKGETSECTIKTLTDKELVVDFGGKTSNMTRK